MHASFSTLHVAVCCGMVLVGLMDSSDQLSHHGDIWIMSMDLVHSFRHLMVGGIADGVTLKMGETVCWLQPTLV